MSRPEVAPRNGPSRQALFSWQRRAAPAASAWYPGRIDSLLDLYDLRFDQQADEWLEVMLEGRDRR